MASLAPGTSAFDALYALNATPNGLLPVLEGPRLVGILRHRDMAVFVQVQLARKNAK